LRTSARLPPERAALSPSINIVGASDLPQCTPGMK
jgi:hypothetical protein